MRYIGEIIRKIKEEWAEFRRKLTLVKVKMKVKIKEIKDTACKTINKILLSLLNPKINKVINKINNKVRNGYIMIDVKM